MKNQLLFHKESNFLHFVIEEKDEIIKTLHLNLNDSFCKLRSWNKHSFGDLRFNFRVYQNGELI